ncbi:hypothetical protein ABIA69_002187 [Lysinibacillus parviboronicapiens]|uniref:Uncharacterized protein n=1 Tax=Lysinibacillus parviboronicapiens TaxID=436516 RepID=A0ABV2PJB1_9BACI
MKRFWLYLPDKNDSLEITTANNKFSLFESSNEKVYTIDTGTYSIQMLVDKLVSKGLDAKVNHLKTQSSLCCF